MPKAPKKVEPQAEEPKLEESLPAVEPQEPSAPVEAPVEVVEAPAEVPAERESLGSLGLNLIPITFLGKKELHGRFLNEVHLQDGTQYLLSDEDFKNQHNP